jgi:hypothetical protein
MVICNLKTRFVRLARLARFARYKIRRQNGKKWNIEL